MPTIRRSTGGRLGLASAALMVLSILGGQVVQAQMMHFTQRSEPEHLSIGSPISNEAFCDGDVCPGQTCDEVNNRCIGNVTLQPPMGSPLAALTAPQLARFENGRIDFDRNFTEAEGLGPTFNQVSCGNCHNTPLGGSGTITVNRFGAIDPDTLAFDPLAELGGSLQQKEAIRPECAEIIPFPPANVVAQRVTNSTLGFGLVERIADADIQANELAPPSPNVSGRTHVVPVLEAPGFTAVGRFGWKAQVATVLSFAGDASLNEMGLTNRLVPTETAANGDQALLAQCDAVLDPEDFDDALGFAFIDRVTHFQRLLAPPPQTPRSGMAGEALFVQVGCADCHVRSFTTGLGHTPFVDDEDADEDDDATLAGKQIHPYTDFLLHDMGFAADFIAQGGATIFELRTPPLWGMRIRDPMWHDGRVAGGNLAFRIKFPGGVIDQHDQFGSESQVSAQAFRALSAAQQDAIVAFLDSLGRREFDLNGDGNVDDADAMLASSCAASVGPFSPDDVCAIADTDQDGDVDADDLALLDVALGTVIPGSDEGEDEDADEGADLQADLPNSNLGDSGHAGVVFANDQVQNTPQVSAPSPSKRHHERPTKPAARRPANRGL